MKPPVSATNPGYLARRGPTRSNGPTDAARIVRQMSYELRRIAFLEREDRVKHYGIAVGGGTARPALADATRRAATRTIPPGAAGFTRRRCRRPRPGDVAAYLDRALAETLV